MAPIGPAIRVTEKAPLGELYRSRGGHYDVYQGGVSFDDCCASNSSSSTAMRKLWRHDRELDWTLYAATAELVEDAVGERGHAGIKKRAPDA